MKPTTHSVKTALQRKHAMKSTTNRLGSRTGLTLIEVLSAIGVAAIGVFGVLVLVPLASRMSQIGIANEATRQNAANVIEKAKSFGALNTSRWIRFDQVAGAYLPVTFNSPGAYCFDPMLISAPARNPDLAITNTAAINLFPYTSGPATVVPTDRITMNQVPNSVIPVGPAMAETMMGQRDMLRTAPALSDVTPPTQAMLRDLATNVAIKREAEGSKTGLSLFLPTDQPGAAVHRMISVVMSNRRFETTNFDRVFNVFDLSGGTQIQKPAGGVLDLILEEADYLPAALDTTNLPSRGWVILIPWYTNAMGANVYAWQHARSYQIRSSDLFDRPVPEDPSVPPRYQVALVGLPFAAPSLSTAGMPSLQQMRTRAIYLPGAVDVRECEVRLNAAEY